MLCACVSPDFRIHSLSSHSSLHLLFLPGRLPLLLVDLMVGVTQFDLRVVCQAGRDGVQLQVFVVLHRETPTDFGSLF